eukprot:TRINITY_DN4900_c0_g1_i1.p1 TRINITY_DN4900_c0_g1~~TRINITY_DN4900_c0_g1_i1.p1  ORF type:complete len:709 (-),score=86.99 TRINITY_DN4900_c0_g1_i1:981-3107(-)
MKLDTECSSAALRSTVPLDTDTGAYPEQPVNIWISKSKRRRQRARRVAILRSLEATAKLKNYVMHDQAIMVQNHVDWNGVYYNHFDTGEMAPPGLLLPYYVPNVNKASAVIDLSTVDRQWESSFLNDKGDNNFFDEDAGSSRSSLEDDSNADVFSANANNSLEANASNSMNLTEPAVRHGTSAIGNVQKAKIGAEQVDESDHNTIIDTDVQKLQADDQMHKTHSDDDMDTEILEWLEHSDITAHKSRHEILYGMNALRSDMNSDSASLSVNRCDKLQSSMHDFENDDDIDPEILGWFEHSDADNANTDVQILDTDVQKLQADDPMHKTHSDDDMDTEILGWLEHSDITTHESRHEILYSMNALRSDINSISASLSVDRCGKLSDCAVVSRGDNPDLDKDLCLNLCSAKSSVALADKESVVSDISDSNSSGDNSDFYGHSEFNDFRGGSSTANLTLEQGLEEPPDNESVAGDISDGDSSGDNSDASRHGKINVAFSATHFTVRAAKITMEKLSSTCSLDWAKDCMLRDQNILDEIKSQVISKFYLMNWKLVTDMAVSQLGSLPKTQVEVCEKAKDTSLSDDLLIDDFCIIELMEKRPSSWGGSRWETVNYATTPNFCQMCWQRLSFTCGCTSLHLPSEAYGNEERYHYCQTCYATLKIHCVQCGCDATQDMPQGEQECELLCFDCFMTREDERHNAVFEESSDGSGSCL